MAIRSVCRGKKMEKESGHCDLGPCGSGPGNSTTVIVISTTDGSIE